jgi:hypothetical protein
MNGESHPRMAWYCDCQSMTSNSSYLSQVECCQLYRVISGKHVHIDALVSLTPLKYTPCLGQLLAQFIIDNMQVFGA